MSENTETNKVRINLRLQQSTKDLLERAARFRGKTVSSFILGSAVAVAEKTVLEHETMRLHAKNAERFIEALSQNAPFNDAMLDALNEHEKRVITD
jgi:uncharacterized protein (DUF1778 family)